MVAFVVLGLAGMYLRLCLPSATPSASVHLVGYTARGDSLVATMVLTNTGPSALTYIGPVPHRETYVRHRVGANFRRTNWR